MARNVELKARVTDLTRVRAKAESLAGPRAEVIHQIDTFFIVPTGRLKVRRFADGSGELIAYDRPDRTGPRTSTYTRAACADADALVRALASVLPVRGTVVKRRDLFLIGPTRVHLDEVESLGTFVELEVVLGEDESIENGEVVARDLLQLLGLSEASLVPGAYIDLLDASS